MRKNTLLKGIDTFSKDFKAAHQKACIAVGLQLLNNCNNGSPNETVVPPIDTGLLRGSASVFVNNKLIGVGPKVNGLGDPLTSFSVKAGKNQTVITIIYNTSYATKLHEKPFNLGPGSEKAGNVGNKWITKHLRADKEEFKVLYVAIIRKNQRVWK